MTTRAFVVASTPMARAGLRSMLANAEEIGVRVVGEAASPAGLVFSEADVVLLMDEELLEEAAIAVAEDGIQALVVISEEDQMVSRLQDLPLKGWGIVPPDAPPEELAIAVSAAAQGLILLHKPLTDRLRQVPAASSVEELSEPLTAREREVLDLLGRGLSNKLIARELHISEHTVKFHISSLYTKLGVNNRAEAVSQGARHGLISL